ncbi:MAG: hypothetical protein M3N95_13740 [Actinomycetota bacterium]|nr:hypothetical protein [Actinomycetota bacterium]
MTEARERIDIPDDDLPEGWRGDLALLDMLPEVHDLILARWNVNLQPAIVTYQMGDDIWRLDWDHDNPERYQGLVEFDLHRNAPGTQPLQFHAPV